MSTKVAVLCEDHTNDRFIFLEPLVAAALRAIGVPRPRVWSVTNPRMSGGFSTLLTNLCAVVTRYHKTVDLVVVAFDLDGEDGLEGRPDKAARVRRALRECDAGAVNVVLLGCVMEAEIYAIWGTTFSDPCVVERRTSGARPEGAVLRRTPAQGRPAGERRRPHSPHEGQPGIRLGGRPEHGMPGASAAHGRPSSRAPALTPPGGHSCWPKGAPVGFG